MPREKDSTPAPLRASLPDLPCKPWYPPGRSTHPTAPTSQYTMPRIDVDATHPCKTKKRVPAVATPVKLPPLRPRSPQYGVRECLVWRSFPGGPSLQADEPGGHFYQQNPHLNLLLFTYRTPWKLSYHNLKRSQANRDT